MAEPTPPREGYGALADRVKSIETELRELRSPSGTQKNRAVPVLRETVEELQAVVDAQADQIAALEGLVAFLQGSKLTDVRATIESGTRGASGSISLDSFNSTYDCQISLTTTGTGLLEVTVGAQLTGSGISAILGFEVLWSGGSIDVDWARSAAAGEALATTSRVSLVSVPANTAVTVRTRRGWTGVSGGLGLWGYQSLIVTKVGQ